MLALATSAPEAHISSSLVAPRTRGSDGYDSSWQVAERERAMEQRRKERESQHHTQIWTKAAHGGPYRKVKAHPLASGSCDEVKRQAL